LFPWIQKKVDVGAHPFIFSIAKANIPPNAPWVQHVYMRPSPKKKKGGGRTYLPLLQKKNTKKSGGLGLNADTRE
jgi:hypothetical protein